MTVSEAIIKWLKTFKLEDQKMRHIDTDLLHGNIDYALIKEPVQKCENISFRHQSYYRALHARCATSGQHKYRLHGK